MGWLGVVVNEYEKGATSSHCRDNSTLLFKLDFTISDYGAQCSPPTARRLDSSLFVNVCVYVLHTFNVHFWCHPLSLITLVLETGTRLECGIHQFSEAGQY